jgi:hypothetical protein
MPWKHNPANARLRIQPALPEQALREQALPEPARPEHPLPRKSFREHEFKYPTKLYLMK